MTIPYLTFYSSHIYHVANKYILFFELEINIYTLATNLVNLFMLSKVIYSETV